MGEESARNAEQLTRENRGRAEPAPARPAPGRPDTGNRNGAENRSADTRTAPGTGAGDRTRTAEEKRGAETEKLPVLSPVPVPEKPKKGTTKKEPRKPRKKKTEPTFGGDQLSALIVTISAIIASREGFEMFALSEIEAKQIAEPLANMIAKSEQLSKVSEHADAVALVTACIVIFVPRLMLYLDQQKKNKRKERPKLVRTDDAGKSEKPDRQSSGKAGQPTPVNAHAVSSILSPLA